MDAIKKFPKIIGLIFGVFLFALLYVAATSLSDNEPTLSDRSFIVPTKFENSGLNVDFSKSSVDINEILDGGPGKDGILSLVDPMFTSHEDARTSDDTQVIYLERNGVERLYPYNILVWHEIVNDIVGGMPLIITFCPLCGSAIVYEAIVDDQVLEFGVSGYLYESNMIMYSREDPETLWSQSLGRAIVGDRLGQELEHYPFELLDYRDAKSRYPTAVVLSSDTGHSRNYDENPYSGYEDTEELTFPVSNTDARFPAKELFYIVPLEGMSVAVRQNKDDGIYRVPDTNIDVTFKNGNISAAWGEAELPGYYEMWFSWAAHHQNNGILFD
jgi:hypothetical protein